MENQFNHFGVMIDCSRNAVMNVTALKKFILCLNKMGYDTVELYTEDTYKLDNDPYFGYLRGAYTKEEIKEIDNYCISLGMTLIPCIQTLAHYTVLKNNPKYADIFDIDDILLCDEPKTYEFIDNLFRNVSEMFTSREINIGMDEAHLIGRGNFLNKFGLQDKHEIILRHLNKVSDIAKKYGFTCHMWGDMFFRIQDNNNIGQYYSYDAHLDERVKKLIPENVRLTYWDYYHTDKKMYDSMINAHLDVSSDVWFAGGAWSWVGFAPLNTFTLESMIPAMKSVKEKGLKNVFITMWGDNGGECSRFALLPSLYYIKKIAEGVTSKKEIKDGFKELFGIPFDSYMNTELPNQIPEFIKKNKGHQLISSSAKSILYSDPFLGILDPIIKDAGYIPFEEYERKLKKYAKNEEFGFVFESLSKLSKVLKDKYQLGFKTREAYKAKDMTTLKELIPTYKKVLKELNEFYKVYRTQWFTENKPFGFEVIDIRLGGLSRRFETCISRLEDYLNGKIEVIEELEEIILGEGEEHGNLCFNTYSLEATQSIL